MLVHSGHIDNNLYRGSTRRSAVGFPVVRARGGSQRQAATFKGSTCLAACAATSRVFMTMERTSVVHVINVP